ncbi:12130_t:CDS:2 [Funneliformis mosseae]|uniref:12130_t:CDS:1 n=1 Tax=Funneliformis mosseae TaxID=27381 RepID=A0A9N8YSA4_FUNMO|nr:12130_t:CDS:2 [Funneliformis mosseae]
MKYIKLVINNYVETEYLIYINLAIQYGTDIMGKWIQGDPEERKLPDGRITTFNRLAK